MEDEQEDQEEKKNREIVHLVKFLSMDFVVVVGGCVMTDGYPGNALRRRPYSSCSFAFLFSSLSNAIRRCCVCIY